MEVTPFSAVILAAGASTRMGVDKAWLHWQGKPLIVRQIETVRAAGAREVFVSGRRDGNYSGLEVPVLHDVVTGRGPLAGIERGLTEAGNPLVFFLAVDMPGITEAGIRQLAACCGPGLGVVPLLVDQVEPACAFYPREMLALARQQLERQRSALTEFARRGVQEGHLKLVHFGADQADLFQNWNEPGDVRASMGQDQSASMRYK